MVPAFFYVKGYPNGGGINETRQNESCVWLALKFGFGVIPDSRTRQIHSLTSYNPTASLLEDFSSFPLLCSFYSP